MPDYKRVPLNFALSKPEDRAIYDALMQYPAGVRSHVMRCALASYLLHVTGDTIALALLENREAFLYQQRSFSDDQVKKSVDKTPPKAKVVGMVESRAEVSHASPSTGKKPAEPHDTAQKNTIPVLDEENKALLRNMLSMIQ